MEHLDLSDVNRFGQILGEANAVSKHLFVEFWSTGGNDMAVLSAALSRGKVLTRQRCFDHLFRYIAGPRFLSVVFVEHIGEA